MSDEDEDADESGKPMEQCGERMRGCYGWLSPARWAGFATVILLDAAGPCLLGAREVVSMSKYEASYVGVNADTDNGEGWVVFRWPHEHNGYEELTIDLDGHCRLRMPLYSGAGPPRFVELCRGGIRIRFDPMLAQKLGLAEEIEISFHLPDAEFVELRRVVDYFGGTGA